MGVFKDVFVEMPFGNLHGIVKCEGSRAPCLSGEVA